MNRILVLIAAAGAVGLAACATDPEYGQAEADTAAVMQAANERGDQVCERVQITGTRFFREVCMSADEYERRAAAARETTDRLSRSSDLDPYRAPN